MEEGNPEAALPNIVEGRVNGFYKDVVLLEQPSVSDNKKTAKARLDEAGVTITRFFRFEVVRQSRPSRPERRPNRSPRPPRPRR